MEGLGIREIVIIAIVLLLLFGPKKIPELARSITEAIRHVREAFRDTDPAATKSTTTKK